MLDGRRVEDFGIPKWAKLRFQNNRVRVSRGDHMTM